MSNEQTLDPNFKQPGYVKSYKDREVHPHIKELQHILTFQYECLYKNYKDEALITTEEEF